ncbi:uncharacterized protein LOC116292113 [Actinia tenebrosa]|uniref:Uncharacterized protein LOC116292113 n=1 Tax=Actinia tenebrosa TaxID=6105 RepID=A0A6P8HK07_ACTTE|nr:uncharacterized protein LOC116292113 [Actinia tenebrosa]
MEEEPDFSSDANYNTEMESETDPETENEDAQEEESRVFSDDENLRTQPKFIVFWSQLLLLFRFCHTCKADGPLIEAKQVGTMVVVTSTCGNKNCHSRVVVWKSQPNMTGTKIPAGNFLLSFAILLSGASASKTIQMFKHMGLCCFSLATFFKHQNLSTSMIFNVIPVLLLC